MDDQFLQDLDAALDFRATLTAETDRGCALMAAAYLDSRLAAWLESFFVNDSKAAIALLGADRSVSTFSSRIDLAYLLGLISPKERRALHLIRKIRNDFGHVPEPISFDNQSIASRCKVLESLNFYKRDNNRAMFTGAVMAVLAAINVRGRATDHRTARPDVDVGQAINEDPDTRLLTALRDFINASPKEHDQAVANLEVACSELLKGPGDRQQVVKKIVAHIVKRVAEA